MVNMDYESGIRGLKHLAKILFIKDKSANFERFTESFLDRQGYHSWWAR